MDNSPSNQITYPIIYPPKTGNGVLAFSAETLKAQLQTQGGVLLIDKPLTWTSFDVVNKLRYHLKRFLNDKKLKVGHAGTLDPLATGLLIVCIGKMTKQIDIFMGQSKTYTGRFQLGATTPSYDLETEPDTFFPTEHLNREVLEKARLQFMGDIEQLPPLFSAIKQDGKPLYLLARKGETAELKTRAVSIHRFTIDPISQTEIDFEVACSKGTYIRSLAYDFGRACQTGGHLSQLRRTAIGDFSVENAFSVEEFSKIIQDFSEAK
jgi:tRNA pseudouridine55 synthase